MEGFHCSSCGEYHDHLPLGYSVPAPIYWSNEVSTNLTSELNEETCIINGEHFFIRGNVEIPIQNSKEFFIFTIWVSLSQTNYEQALQRWDEPARDQDEPYFGWFSSRLVGYPDTLNLKTMVHTRPIGIVPSIELEPTEHPLAIEQRNGLTMERVKQLAAMILHPE